MTADHAGQTGGERDPHWIKDHFGLDGDAGGEPEVCDPVSSCPGHVLNLPWSNGAVWCTEMPGRYTPVQPSRPVPVAGQPLGAPLGEVTVGRAAREAAVEAVARELGRHQGLRGPMDDDRPDVWQNRCECGWDDGDEHPGWRERYRLHVAVATLSLPEVAALSECSVSTTDALSAAGGQDEWVRCSCGRAVPCRHCDTDGQEQP